MNESREPLDHETAERLLDGGRVHPRSGAASLASLLASAASAPQAHELAGEDAAVMAFRAAHRERTQHRVSWWRRLITFKVIAIIVAATAGGLAFASSTGMLPAPFAILQQPPAKSAPPTGADHTAQPNPAPESGKPSADPSSDPADSPAGMCHAYLAKSPSERGKALDTPAFSQLIVLAGSANKVDGYCEGLEADKAEKSHSPRPSKPTR
jgi:hypothetical protein